MDLSGGSKLGFSNTERELWDSAATKPGGCFIEADLIVFFTHRVPPWIGISKRGATACARSRFYRMLPRYAQHVWTQQPHNIGATVPLRKHTKLPNNMQSTVHLYKALTLAQLPRSSCGISQRLQNLLEPTSICWDKIGSNVRAHSLPNLLGARFVKLSKLVFASIKGGQFTVGSFGVYERQADRDYLEGLARLAGEKAKSN